VPTDNAFKAAALGVADGVDDVAFGKEVRADDVTGFHVFGEIAEFLNALDRDTVEFLEVSEQGFGYAMFFLVVKTKLNGFVTIALDGFALDDPIRVRLNNRDMDSDAFLVVNASLAQFFSE
jgi:hypothetical protein